MPPTLSQGWQLSKNHCFCGVGTGSGLSYRLALGMRSPVTLNEGDLNDVIECRGKQAASIKKSRASGFRDRDHCRMFELSVQRNGKELFANCAGLANNRDTILPPDIGANHRWSEKQAKPALAKNLQQRTIFTFGDRKSVVEG